MLETRLLRIDEADAAADLHRRAGALIPDYDTSLHSPEEYQTFYRRDVMSKGPVWGAFERDTLRGHIALIPGWIDHLYVDPDFHRTGIGSSLVRLAQKEQAELRLYTFQSNMRGRFFYESLGFVIEEFTDGQRNEEKMPDMTYYWSRSS
jgi:ribosomal protein S18 acetylase RimI-like enzyme